MIRIKDLNYSYPDGTRALSSICLDISRGEFVAITGKNGCGKSTLLRHMNGLLIPGSGSVSVDGMNTTDPLCLLKIRQVAGMVFQDPGSQFIGMTVEEDVAFGPENLCIRPDRIRDLVKRSLSDVGMLEYRDNTPRTLSGGQKQRVAIASVLAMEPDIILFDEVTSMLDPLSRKDVLALIGQLHENGTTIVYVTHRLEELVHADRVLVMDGGRIIHDGEPRALLAKYDVSGLGVDLPPVPALSKRLAEVGIVSMDDLPLSKEELLGALCQFK